MIWLAVLFSILFVLAVAYFSIMDAKERLRTKNSKEKERTKDWDND